MKSETLNDHRNSSIQNTEAFTVYLHPKSLAELPLASASVVLCPLLLSVPEALLVRFESETLDVASVDDSHIALGPALAVAHGQAGEVGNIADIGRGELLSCEFGAVAGEASLSPLAAPLRANDTAFDDALFWWNVSTSNGVLQCVMERTDVLDRLGVDVCRCCSRKERKSEEQEGGGELHFCWKESWLDACKVRSGGGLVLEVNEEVNECMCCEAKAGRRVRKECIAVMLIPVQRSHVYIDI